MTISSKINIKNRRASFEYHLLERFEAGVRLLGTEIKSIRQGKANINDSFCSFIDGELYIRNMHIAEYSHGSFYNHEAKGNRKLLLHKRVIKKLETKHQEQIYTIIHSRILIINRLFANIQIALSQHKTHYK